MINIDLIDQELEVIQKLIIDLKDLKNLFQDLMIIHTTTTIIIIIITRKEQKNLNSRIDIKEIEKDLNIKNHLTSQKRILLVL